MRQSRQPQVFHICPRCRAIFRSIKDLEEHSNQIVSHGLSPMRLSRLRISSARNEPNPPLKDLAANETMWPEAKMLRENQGQLDELETEFLKKKAVMEMKYQKWCHRLYNQRHEIVNGALEAKEKGVPCFWLNALKNNGMLAEKITKRDEEVLKFLKDIKSFRTNNTKGFSLKFLFDTNPFFKNSVLTKTYKMSDDDEDILEKAIGSEIEWFPGKCLTKGLRPKKRSKFTTRFGKIEEDSGSFFDFFGPPEITEQDEEITANVAEELKYHMEQDYDIALTIHSEIIPHAVAWFTRPGRSLEDYDEIEFEAKEFGSGNFYYTFDDSPDDKDLVDLTPALSLANIINALNDLSGQHVEEVPSPNVKKLLEIQRRHDEVEAEFLKMRAALEDTYEKLYRSLYEERYNLIGEPSRCETQSEEGVHSFWLIALKNNSMLTEVITKGDEAPLKFLKDIKCLRQDDPKGFRLEFLFDNNPFFQNSVLTKTYQMIDEDEHILEKAIGTKIQWYPGSFLSSRKRPKRGSKFKSFFYFFSPPRVPGADTEITVDAAERLLNLMQQDYDIGLTIRKKIIPHTFKWFMAKSIQFDNDEDDSTSCDMDSHWAEMPDHMLESLLERMPIASDFLRFSDVCKSWKSVANYNIGKHSGHPMALICTGKEETWDAYDLSNDEDFSLQLEFAYKGFCGVSKGWLIRMDDNFIVTLTNPFSRVDGRREKGDSVISFPALKLPETCRKSRATRSNLYVSKAAISSDPMYDTDCIIMIVFDQLCQLAYARFGGDRRWTYIDARFHSINDIVFVERKLYALDVLNQVFCFNFYAEQFNLEDVEFVAEGLEEPQRLFKTRYLVEFDHKQLLLMGGWLLNYSEESYHVPLLMVHRTLTYSGPPNRRRVAVKFEVFRLDVDERRWTKISDLGDVALFVGEMSAKSVLASDFGCLPNCIYFVHNCDHEAAGHQTFDFGVYNIKSQRLERNVYTKHAATLIERSNQTPIWIMGPSSSSGKGMKKKLN